MAPRPSDRTARPVLSLIRNEYIIALDKLPLEPSACSVCGKERVPCLLSSSVVPQPRWGCGDHEVVLLTQASATEWIAALRSIEDPWWERLPFPLREPAIRAGFGEHTLRWPLVVATAYEGSIWIGDRAMWVRSGEPAEDLSTRWDALHVATTERTWDGKSLRDDRARRGFDQLERTFVEPDYMAAELRPVQGLLPWDRGLVEIGAATASASRVAMVHAIHGEDVFWEAREPRDPLRALDEKHVPVAMVMPMARRAERVRAVAEAEGART